jgi:hypothetical protein
VGLGQSPQGTPIGTFKEALYELKGSVAAGTWHVIMDATIIAAVDMTFELIWRRTGVADIDIVSWQQHFTPVAGNFDAQAYEVDEVATAIDFEPGDEFVFRYTAGANTTSAEAFIPNGDGARSHGRHPSFSLPQ